ncbi:MAG: UDP-N-acetylmuramate--L-alanine ligase [Planctomycetes bacterium]|nr:UDP-N-acetylmuramate--L-alanine ligase [Planctomycetota bacterium]
MRIGSDRVHLVGVGGAGMSALARLLAGIGAQLSGSDVHPNAVVEELRAEGIPIWTGHRPEVLTGENGYVVRSAAVPDTDPEVVECVRRGFTSLLYAEVVGRLSEGKRTLAVAGTHGKTTTTALVVSALRGAGLDPSHMIGGEVPELGGNGYGGRDDLFVIEACEFNRSFLNLRPSAAAILNLDHDHFDCYPSLGEFHDAFAAYASRVRPGGTVLIEETVPERVVDSIAREVRVRRVGSGLFANIRALDVAEDLGRYSFVPFVDGRRLPRVRLAQPGRFQISNALFAIGLVASIGADLDGACEGISGFAGVRRRFEMHEGPSGGLLVNDYAHHPAEIAVVIRAARKRFPGRPLLAVFQPHQHMRTLRLLPEFADALALADRALIAPIYGARESAEVKASIGHGDLVAAIRERGGSSEPVDSREDLVRRVASLRGPGELVLVLGAGDIDEVVEELVRLC